MMATIARPQPPVDAMARAHVRTAGHVLSRPRHSVSVRAGTGEPAYKLNVNKAVDKAAEGKAFR